MDDVPWIVVGDFKAIRSDDERIEGNPRPLSSMVDFNDCLDRCGLFELSHGGRQMSWCNGHEGQSRSWQGWTGRSLTTIFLVFSCMPNLNIWGG